MQNDATVLLASTQVGRSRMIIGPLTLSSTVELAKKRSEACGLFLVSNSCWCRRKLIW